MYNPGQTITVVTLAKRIQCSQRVGDPNNNTYNCHSLKLPRNVYTILCKGNTSKTPTNCVIEVNNIPHAKQRLWIILYFMSALKCMQFSHFCYTFALLMDISTENLNWIKGCIHKNDLIWRFFFIIQTIYGTLRCFIMESNCKSGTDLITIEDSMWWQWLM